MTSRPWLKFYPSDWQSDERLGMCSLAARGLWMEMLALMHKADPYGHLLVNGMKPSDEQLAALARASCDQIRTCVHELEQHGVFSRTRNGTIYSRRMTKDEKKRKDGANAAESGTIEGSRRSKQAIGNKSKKEPPPMVAYRGDEQPPLLPETRDQRPEYSDPNGSLGANAPAALPLQEAFDAYNAKAAELSLPSARTLNADRKRKLKARLREHGIEGWRTALDELGKSEFLTGQNGRGWCADFDFLLTPSKLTKVIEGGYRSVANGHGPPLIPGTEAFARALRNAEQRKDNDEFWRLKRLERQAAASSN